MSFALAPTDAFVAPGHDWSAMHQIYARATRIQVRNFLAPAAAAAVSDALAGDMPWALNWMEGEAAMNLAESAWLHKPAEERVAQRVRLVEQARTSFQFSYFGCPMAPQALSLLPPDHALRGIAARMVSHEFLDAVTELVGDAAIRGMNANLTRYDPGQFLRYHDDSGTQEPRVAAYVLNLSVDWAPDWGGVLQFVDAERDVVQTFTPHYNSLVVFKVPQPHVVSYVAPFAARSRLAVTGWLIR
jgi:SM-20-related protein